MTGAIPAALGALDDLRELRLDNNGLAGEIPAALGALTNLRELGLADNGLTGEVPAALDGLVNLRQGAARRERIERLCAGALARGG